MKAKIFTLIFFGIMLVSVSRSYAQNILTDGDFSLTTAIEPVYGSLPPNVWCTFQGYFIEANATVVNGVCNYYISPTAPSGDYTWEIQLIQAGFPLVQGHSYRLTFDVKADDNRTFGVFLGENDGNWTDLLGYDKYTQNATTEWQTISLEFNATCVFPYHKLSFELGTIPVSMYFDNIMLEDIGPYSPTVGILGTSTGSWDTDINMLTDDNEIYTISDVPLTHGWLIFRQDDMWCNVWCNSTFPSGTGILYGPGIWVPNDDIYNITFNRKTLEYSFSCSGGCKPFIGILGDAVPPDHSWETDANMQTSRWDYLYAFRCRVYRRWSKIQKR